MEMLNLDHLPLQKALVESVYNAFVNEENVIAAVLLGHCLQEREDRVSDAGCCCFHQKQFP